MAGWWDGLSKAFEVVSGLSSRGSRPETGGDDPSLPASRGLLGGFEARMAGVLVSALHEAFARDAARLDAERAQAEAEARRAEAALRLELARQEAERQLGQVRAAAAMDILVWLASVVVVVAQPPSSLVAKSLFAAAWLALTLAVGAAFIAYARVSERAAAAGGPGTELPTPSRIVARASMLTVAGLGLTAAAVLASLLR